MGFWAAAIPIASAVLGGLGGKSKSKAKNEKYSRMITPPSQLGGWGRLQDVLNSLNTAPRYQLGANNPYLAGGLAHLMGRAGIQAPEGGFPNPYLNPPQIAAASTPAPTPQPTPTPRPNIKGAKKTRDQLIKEIG